MEVVYESAKTKELLVPIKDKYMLSLREGAAYFNINEKRIRRIIEEHPGELGMLNGNKMLVNRRKFEEYLDVTSAI